MFENISFMSFAHEFAKTVKDFLNGVINKKVENYEDLNLRRGNS